MIRSDSPAFSLDSITAALRSKIDSFAPVLTAVDVGTVKEVGDGWIPLRSGTIDNVTRLRQDPEWPQDITIIVGRRIIVAESHDEALAEATAEYERGKAAGAPGIPPTVEAFIANNIIGSADECLQQLATLEEAGINYVRCAFTADAPQERVSRLLISRLDEIPSGKLVARV
jgi:alkanesulfonate monooxygenase SsuD/methylene tetrahydromethanopterin reductase-like flavin-dependent oxidoreductase (luciferase family)